VNSTPAAPYAAINYYEWCQDHNKPLQATPVGDVPSGGPATLPDPNIFTNGACIAAAPILVRMRPTARAGPPAIFSLPTLRPTRPTSAAGRICGTRTIEREITTNNVFPGGMLMMMLVDAGSLRSTSPTDDVDKND